MEKPVVFFSHSGKDRRLLLPIKEKIEEATSNTISIFMSSDGQSIPFGKNWIAQIEKGLQETKLMFVFVTPNSLESGWIYFETGYAYGKDIKVVPIGIGVSIGGLKPPINMLQGFDITSGESLNNIITIINREFSCTYKPCFDERDFLLLTENEMQKSSLISNLFSDINSIVETEEYKATEKLSKIENKLKEENIVYSCKDNLLLVGGIRIEKIEAPSIGWTYAGKPKEFFLELSLSTHYLLESFDILKHIKSAIDKDMLWLKCSLFSECDCLTKPEDISAVVSKNPTLFSHSILAPHIICYKGKFHVNLLPENKRRIIATSTTDIRIGFNPEDVAGADFCELISALIETGIIIE